MEDILVWNGSTDAQGRTDFNISLDDSNYTASLRPEAFKESYADAIDVAFLSETPIILKMRYFTDLNGMARST